MTDEEKLYTLMAQAEDLQTHAANLQNKAQETFSALPLAVEQAGQKIRSTGLQMAFMMLGVGIIVCVASTVFIGWSTDSLREEHAALKAVIQAEKASLTELESKTWRITLMEWNNGERGIILPEGVKFVRPVKVKDGRDAVVINP
jgi:hypothetical protein